MQLYLYIIFNCLTTYVIIISSNQLPGDNFESIHFFICFELLYLSSKCSQNQFQKLSKTFLQSTEMSNSSLLLFYTYQRRLYTIHTVKLGPPPRGFGCMHFLTKTKIAVAPTIIIENKNPFSIFQIHTNLKTFVKNIFQNF